MVFTVKSLLIDFWSQNPWFPTTYVQLQYFHIWNDIIILAREEIIIQEGILTNAIDVYAYIYI